MDRIRVTPEKLNSTANEIKSIQSNVVNITRQMTQTVQGAGSDWTGDASTRFIQKFQKLQDDMQKISNMLDEHVTDLNTMSATFARAEATAESISSSLADDVIS